MSDVVADKSLTRSEVDKTKASFELDLIAYFKQLEEDVFDIVEKGQTAGLSPDEIINEVEDLFNE